MPRVNRPEIEGAVWMHWYVVVESADGEDLIGPYATRREATIVAGGQLVRPPASVSVRFRPTKTLAASSRAAMVG
jgi:hypothetical protein